ncbi:hypothetical protein Mapa_009840 [Marchantia paleacea]|nr:hypothetical protein Mapa_009840 [Marchantia paleacea]
MIPCHKRFFCVGMGGVVGQLPVLKGEDGDVRVGGPQRVAEDVVHDHVTIALHFDEMGTVVHVRGVGVPQHSIIAGPQHCVPIFLQ